MSEPARWTLQASYQTPGRPLQDKGHPPHRFGSAQMMASSDGSQVVLITAAPGRISKCHLDMLTCLLICTFLSLGPVQPLHSDNHSHSGKLIMSTNINVDDSGGDSHDHIHTQNHTSVHMPVPGFYPTGCITQTSMLLSMMLYPSHLEHIVTVHFTCYIPFVTLPPCKCPMEYMLFFDPKTSVLFHERHLYAGSLDREMSGDSRNASLHCGMVLVVTSATCVHHRLCPRCLQAIHFSWKPMSCIPTHSTCKPSGSFPAALQQQYHLMAAPWLLFTSPQTNTCHPCISLLHLSPHTQSMRASSRSLLLRGQLSLRQ